MNKVFSLDKEPTLADLQSELQFLEQQGDMVTGLVAGRNSTDNTEFNIVTLESNGAPLAKLELFTSASAKALDTDAIAKQNAGYDILFLSDEVFVESQRVPLGAARNSNYSAALPPAPVPQPNVAGAALVQQILQIAATSRIARHTWWKGQDRAPIGYIKGMALTFGRVCCKLNAGDPIVQEMAMAETGDPTKDVLAYYRPRFDAFGMSNQAAGFDTLRHLFMVLIGLAMPESSGRYWIGLDGNAPGNANSEECEAGLFQTSWNARAASKASMVQLFQTYSANPSGFLDVFKEGVRPGRSVDYGTGDGKKYQRLCKDCPAFAAEFTAVGLRHIGGGTHSGRRWTGHWGTVGNDLVELAPECDTMLQDVQNAVGNLAQFPI